MNKIITMLTRSQKLAYLKIKSGLHVILTGVAGTGKTYLLNQLEELTGKRVYLTASTGGASLHLNNGRTVSSFLGLGKYNKKTAKYKCKAMLDNCILVIDEFCMIGAEQWEYIIRSIKKNSKDWRTVQIILAGDPGQMPPMHWDTPLVRLNRPKRTIELASQLKDFTQVELKEIVRQKDAQFIERLMDIRYNGVRNHFEWIKQNSGNLEKRGSNLVSTRSIMNRLNAKVKPGEIIASCDLRKFDDKDNKPYDTLDVWKGMRVLITTNWASRGYVNGDTGEVVDVYSSGFRKVDIMVRLDRTGEVVYVGESVREYTEITYELNAENKFIEVEKEYLYSYIPLLLAYNISVRRSQGCTLYQGSIHHSVFKSRICTAYTALSRFTSIENINVDKRYTLKRP